MFGLNDLIGFVHLLVSFWKIFMIVHSTSNANAAIVDQIVHDILYILESACGNVSPVVTFSAAAIMSTCDPLARHYQ